MNATKITTQFATSSTRALPLTTIIDYHDYPRAFNEDLKNHIKRVLNFEENNETLDRYITNSFNLYNPDPLYVFVLPGETNQTLVFRRSNFSEAIFPNVTTLQMLRKLSSASKLYANQNLYDKKNGKRWKNEEIPNVKFEQFKKSNYDLDEAASLKIIEENVRTERNFYKFMEDLNSENQIEDSKRSEKPTRPKESRSFNEYELLLHEIHTTGSEGNDNQLLLTGEFLPSHKLKRKRTQHVSWEDMGLDGWSGSLRPLYTFPKGQG